jgi:hypothetical protein
VTTQRRDPSSTARRTWSMFVTVFGRIEPPAGHDMGPGPFVADLSRHPGRERSASGGQGLGGVADHKFIGEERVGRHLQCHGLDPPGGDQLDGQAAFDIGRTLVDTPIVVEHLALPPAATHVEHLAVGVRAAEGAFERVNHSDGQLDLGVLGRDSWSWHGRTLTRVVSPFKDPKGRVDPVATARRRNLVAIDRSTFRVFLAVDVRMDSNRPAITN